MLTPKSRQGFQGRSPCLDFGFYFKTPEAEIDQVYYTQSALNPAGETSHTHFAVFGEALNPGPRIYWLGMEDLRAGKGDDDYQDLVVRIRANPEPSTFILLTGGAALLLWLRRRAIGSRLTSRG
jgi:hypothetical protein